jgi:hypothetical protein
MSSVTYNIVKEKMKLKFLSDFGQCFCHHVDELYDLMFAMLKQTIEAIELNQRLSDSCDIYR